MSATVHDQRHRVTVDGENVDVVAVGTQGASGVVDVITAEGDLIVGGVDGVPAARAVTDQDVVRLSYLGILPNAGNVTTTAQSALTTHAGKHILFDRPGEYLVDNLSIPDGTIIDAVPGAVLRHSGASLVSDFDNATLHNATVPGAGITVRNVELKSAFDVRQLGFSQVTTLTIQDVAITEVNEQWATVFLDCVDLLITGYRQVPNTTVSRDGLHIVGGQRITIDGSRITSGDDCIALTHPSAQTELTDIEDVTISNCVLESRDARIFAIGIQSSGGATLAIRRVNVSNITGKAGTRAVNQTRGIAIFDDVYAAGRLEDIKLSNVTVDCSGIPASSSALHYGLDALNVDNLRLHNVTVISPASGGVSLDGCRKATLVDCEARDMRSTDGGDKGFLVNGSDDARLIACRSRDPAVAGVDHFVIGVGVAPSNRCLVLGCETAGAVTGRGVFLRGTIETKVLGCEIGHAGDGIVENGGQDFNEIAWNNLTNCGGTKLTVVGVETWADRNRGVSVYGVSADNGDAGKSLNAQTDQPTQRWNTELTANRTVGLQTQGAVKGSRFRIVREAGATGAFDLNVDSGLKLLSVAGEWCDVVFDGTAWRLMAAGSL